MCKYYEVTFLTSKNVSEHILFVNFHRIARENAIVLRKLIHPEKIVDRMHIIRTFFWGCSSNIDWKGGMENGMKQEMHSCS